MFGNEVKGTGELIRVQMNPARLEKERSDFEQLLKLFTMGLHMVLAPVGDRSWG